MQPFFAYILRCSDGSYYVGHTDNLESRLYQHQHGLTPGYTSKRLPVELMWCSMAYSRDEAKQAEMQLKGWSRAKKEALIRGDIDRLQELAKRSSRGDLSGDRTS